MTRYVALLRAVNLGSHKKIAMPDLRAVCADLGHSDVRTYLQSGNIIFSTTEPVVEKVAQDLEEALAARLGLTTEAILRTADQMRALIDGCPIEVSDPTKVSVLFLRDTPATGWVDGFDAGPFIPEQMWTAGREIYFHLPNGTGRAKLPPAVGRRLNTPATMRNWRTVTNLT
ncbi:DUF1697 domain-containing protein [Herbidospora galbida]|uniref:DUF1697 domain-containing protein n=1 Tax=Herbidospora galbida TaxID=2575442 RepID=UPI001485BAAA|nr:DUF1697 domain-containing protein [Herbidospora galbida]